MAGFFARVYGRRAERGELKMRTTPESNQLLLDHVDARMVAADADEQVADRNAIVQLDPDHPGFRDAEYRARRNRKIGRAHV